MDHVVYFNVEHNRLVFGFLKIEFGRQIFFWTLEDQWS
jgi:hypothetical protein